MAVYVVHLTFRAPGLHRHYEWHRTLLGRQSIVVHGAEGMLAATVTINCPDAALAGLNATELVTRAWRDHGTGGPLERLSWRTERQRVLAGLLRRRSRGKISRRAAEYLWDVGAWQGFDGPDDDGPDDGGLAGVREPRRPKPAPPSLGMSLPLPGDGPQLH